MTIQQNPTPKQMLIRYLALFIFICLPIFAFFLGRQYQRSQVSPVPNGTNPVIQTSPPQSAKLRVCPENWIDNQMPCVSDTPQGCGKREYFIIKGENKNADEVDVDWVRQNCNISPQVLQ